VKKIKKEFPKSLTNQQLVAKVQRSLKKYGYGETTLVATSLCADEVNRPLEKALSLAYGPHFSMGGLAGFPFSGVTGFGAMAHHIPDGGSCLIVYGPHVGVDAEGKVGTVDRRGRAKGGSCCGSAVAAAGYVEGVLDGGERAPPATEAFDAQQNYVGNLLLPHGDRLQAAVDPMVELPYALFDSQDDLMQEIISKACGNVHDPGRIACLGGIQINTPAGMDDYFLPLRFDIRDNKGNLLETLIEYDCRVSFVFRLSK
jgi:Limiting CO2-inducible proteins B/C beta carbonyic anhydrases